MRILVTGASGLIGREICQQLYEQDHEVVALDSHFKYQGHEPSCSIFHDKTIHTFVVENPNNFDMIYHMAAINGTEYFYSIPNILITNNILSDLKIFEYAGTNPKCKIIYASSSEVVSDSNSVPVAEEIDISIKNMHNPRWSYRLGKIVSENYLVNSQLNYIIFRIFNTYSEHSASGHMLRDQLNKIKQGIFELINPNDTRSFCYVADSVRAIITVAELANKEIINVGSDEEITVQEAANIIAKSQGYDNPTWNIVKGHAGSTARRKPDLTKLRNYYPNYQPEKFTSVIDRIKSKLLTTT
jgi:UDP-glucose 4-epimerase